MRWGECVGLRWESVIWDDWDAPCKPHTATYCIKCVGDHDLSVRVVRVAVEVAGTVTTRPFPKTKAGRRTVPIPSFAAILLAEHRRLFPAGASGEVFTNSTGGPLRRTLFRSRVWRPALVRAGLLGKVEELGADKWRATWPDKDGIEWTSECMTERDAVRQVVTHAENGLRFHDLRHSYATWLVSSGVPVNEVARVIGHSRASTTLNRYTHVFGATRDDRVRGALADFSLTTAPEEDQE
jgi:integrase